MEKFMINWKKSNIIEFNCEEHFKGVLPEPKPSYKMIPNFFKHIPAQITNNPKEGTVKRCMPFLDALSEGYIIPLWTDMYVKCENDNINIEFPDNFPQEKTLDQHSINQIPNHPLQDNPYGTLPMKFINPWLIKTPPGISCLFTSPLNHLISEIKILDGIVDTDNYYNNVNFPFLWTGGDGKFFFPVGTPLVHVIPFKRTKFKHKIGTIDQQKKAKTTGLLSTKLANAYKTYFWHKRKL